MSNEPSGKPPKAKSSQEHAKELIEVLDELEGAVNDAREVNREKPVPERILALIADTESLAEGISSGAITVSQPRMAANLIEVATLLDECGEDSLACSFTNLIRSLSRSGLAADNCALGRGRIGPSKP